MRIIFKSAKRKSRFLDWLAENNLDAEELGFELEVEMGKLPERHIDNAKEE